MVDRVKKLVLHYRKELMAIFLFVIMFFVCSMSYAYAMSAPIPSIIITSENASYEEKVPGSWQVEKSAKWISKGRARVTFDVDTTLMAKEEASDIIFVVDTSGSMEGDKLNQVKIDSTNLINDILSNTNNNVALIEFNSNATILSSFTNNKDLLINEINNLQVRDSTNYYNAFLKVDELLQGYQKQDNREVVMMFLTDGYPYEGNPNQVTEYKYLKEAYPYLTVNAIQYEMGDTIINQLKEVSDNQYLAFQDNLGEILGEASITPIPYEEFQIIDYIDNDYYILNSVDDIKVSDGEVKLEEENGTQKITWTIDNYLSGRKAKLTIDLSLKEEYIGQGGVYPTNKSEEVISSIENQHEDVNSNLTPTLAEKYQVIYDGNAPEGVSVENIPDSEAQSVFDTVEITEEEPTCNGYIFQGWEIVTDNVKKVGSDYFIMPEENVTLRAKWSSIKLAKSMDGVVSEQGDPIMKGSSWWTSEYDKDSVTSIEFKTNTDIPDTAIYSWDASQAGDRSVIAYLEDDGSGNGTYKVTIGGRGGVIASTGNALFGSLNDPFSNVISINLINLDTSQVKDMSSMFREARNLTDLELGNFNTSNATDMSFMFSNCHSLTTIDTNEFDTSKVLNTQYMFYNCQSLVDLDVSHFDTSLIINMSHMFQQCYNLEKLDVSSFQTDNVTNMYLMFNNCRSLTELDVSNFDTSNVTDMNAMFGGCNKLSQLDVSGFDTGNVTTMQSMFMGCRSLMGLDVSKFNTSKVTNMSDMFNGCSGLTELDVSSFDTGNVTTMFEMFRNCHSLTTLNLSNFDTSNVTTMQNMFYECRNLKVLNISSFDTQKVTNMSHMFQFCSGLLELNLSNFNTSNVTNVGYMFANCSSLVELDLSNFNTSNVTTMAWMFSNCNNLVNLDINNFDTSKVTNMGTMFYYCSSLISLDLSSFDISNLTTKNGMFNGCSGLTELDLSNFDTSNVTTMQEMFSGCNSLTELDLSSFDTSKVTNMSSMFTGCSNLRKVDFRNADFNSITTFVNMFNNTSNLEVVVKDEEARIWIQDKLGNNGTAIIVSA